MRTFCITLKHSQERQQSTSTTLSKHNLNCEFFSGIDAKNDSHLLLDRIRNKNFERRMGRPAAIGEVGCYASHYLMWQKCVELNEPIIIYEDDFDIDPSLYHSSLHISKKHIEDCGYIRLENTNNHNMSYPVRDYGKQRLVKYLKVPQCMTAYAISPKTAQAFIDHSEHFDYPVDVFLRNTWIHKQPIFGVCQAGLWGGNKPSIIGNRKRKGKKNYFVALMKILHKLMNMTLNLTTNLYHLGKLGSNYKPLRWWIG